ncbi:MAG: twin-arginine translocase TatA/TatE family subunit [Syntrophobacteraceae bacterium]|jgi:sec-independent protein translocase protein TatA
MYGFGIGKVLLVLFVIILLFGGRKLPELGAGIGKAIKNFKKESKNIVDTIRQKSD